MAALMALAQSFSQKTTDTSGFGNRKLKVDEINFVSSYYSQTGNNAAVTGGIGAEKLTDLANVFEVKFIRYDKKMRKQHLDIEAGIDHYTSASSDQIDLKANSSASHSDTRVYPSVSWSVENEKKGTGFGLGVSTSLEFDYTSLGANIYYSAKTKNRNGEFTAKFQTYLDKVTLIMPVELRANPNETEHDYPTTGRNTYAGSLSWSQVINQRLQIMFLADLVQQNGYLSLPFHRVYFKDASVHQENLPDSRKKLPLGFRANYFAGDKLIIRAYYRFYTDDWGIRSHTADIETPVKITPFFSISPFYRFYSQTAISYFAPYQQHTAADHYYTSNYDYSAFTSHFFGVGFRMAPPKGILGAEHFNMIEIRYGHYTRATGLQSNIISMNLKFK